MVENNNKEHFSFSKLSSFHTCKYGYKLRYIDHLTGDNNSFAQYGSLVHSIMERYAKGEIELWNLKDVYEWEYGSAVTEPFPKSKFCDMAKIYYEQGKEYLSSFPGYDKYKILEVESDFEIEIDDWIFVGVMDLLYEDDKGNLILLDYKSKSSFKNKQEKHKYARQLYLYCLYIKQKYGKYPDKMIFMMFRKNNPCEVNFNIEDFEEAIDWAKNTVKEIRECKDFFPTCEEFYANELCNHRRYCKNKLKKFE